MDIKYLEELKDEKSKTIGFTYHLSKAVIREYQKKPIALRLKWLYMGNLLRMGYLEKIKKLHDRFRLT